MSRGFRVLDGGCFGCVVILDVEYKIKSKYGKTLDKQSILS